MVVVPSFVAAAVDFGVAAAFDFAFVSGVSTVVARPEVGFRVSGYFAVVEPPVVVLSSVAGAVDFGVAAGGFASLDPLEILFFALSSFADAAAPEPVLVVESEPVVVLASVAGTS